MKSLRIATLIGATAIVVAAIWVITEPEPEDRNRLVLAPGVREVIENPIHGICVVTATDGASSVSGIMHFRSKGSGVEVSGCIKGLSPGRYRIIVTEFGDLRHVDDGSAGDAFFRSDWPLPSDGSSIAEMMMVEADEFGTVKFEQLNPALTIYGPESIIGRCCLLTRYSSTTSGEHVAAGIIGRANPEWTPVENTPLTAHEAIPHDNC